MSKPDYQFASGRIGQHVAQPNGSHVLVMADGSGCTESEWAEYCANAIKISRQTALKTYAARIANDFERLTATWNADSDRKHAIQMARDCGDTVALGYIFIACERIEKNMSGLSRSVAKKIIGQLVALEAARKVQS